jgi:hypothetical protein
MIDRWNGRPAVTKARAVGLIVAAGPAAVLAFGLAAPAAAAPVSAAPQIRPDAMAAVMLRTLVPNVAVHSSPSKKSSVTGVIKRRGTAVTIACYRNGVPVGGNSVWYLLASPVAGYVTAFYMNTHVDPVSGVGRCGVVRFSRVYHTLTPHLHIRGGPGRNYRTVFKLGGVGSYVRVTCFAYGGSVYGDPVWYHTTRPVGGWVTGFYLNTGQDPAPGVPHCR